MHRRSFLKQLGMGTATLPFVLPSIRCLAVSGGADLLRSTPEAQGMSSRAILDFLDALASSKHEFHSFMLLRHGRVLAEGWWHPYRPEAPQMLYSLSKSFTSTAIGFAVAEGKLKADDKVIGFFPEDLPDFVSENLASLRVKDLLSMSVGHAEDSTGSLWDKENWVKQFLSLPIVNRPGTRFLYNSGATYMLSAIVQKLTGQKVIDYITPRLFVPLNIRGMTWEMCPHGISAGGWGLKLQTEALAKFGQLLSQKGVWDGKQLIPAAWIEEATSFKIQQPAPDLDSAKKNSDWHQGYCYQFWRCRHNAFRGDGAFGQYTIVMPEQEAVIAITSETSSMQGEMDLIWEHLLPAMKDGALTADSSSEKNLRERLASLSLPTVEGQGTCGLAGQISGKQFLVPSTSREQFLSWKFEKDRCVYQVQDGKSVYTVACGLGQWVDGQTEMPGTPPKLTRGDLGRVSKVSACAAWKDDHTLEMRWQFYETPHHDQVICQFGSEGKNVKVEFLNSIAAMGSKKDSRPALLGTLAGS
jgi:hypothetical protein